LLCFTLLRLRLLFTLFTIIMNTTPTPHQRDEHCVEKLFF
jgi:hypothetical protein